MDQDQKTVTLIGTGHVFDLKDALLDIFSQRNPDVLCVELDQQRYHAIIMKKQDPERYKESSKNLPFLYRMLAQFQENMAKRFGVIPGEEMITTIEYAKMYRIPLACIDMHAQNLFRQMIKSMSLREKITFLLSGIGGLFVKSETVEKQVQDISINVDSYLSEIGKRFPTIKRILIDERNEYMAKNIIRLTETYEHLIAIVGDGHINGMTEILKNKGFEIETIRLHDLQNIPKRDSDTSSASFHVDYQGL
jgi:pheromone shutdown-related protein TraB